jgi:TM2 domain-containing membrane protein YozV
MPLVKKIEDKIRKGGTGDAFINMVLFVIFLLLVSISIMWVFSGCKPAKTVTVVVYQSSTGKLHEAEMNDKGKIVSIGKEIK